MGLIGCNLEVLQTGGGSDDGSDIVLPHKILVGGCVEIAEKELAHSRVGIGREDDMVGLVFLLSIIIMKHQLL